MEKTKPNFPWYLIYTPIVTVIVAIWYWCVSTGDVPMDILEKVLIWLKLDDKMVTNIVIIALAILAFLYIFVKWFGTSKTLKAIREVSDTAPEAVKKHISSSCSDLGEKICNSINEDKLRISNDIAKIEANTSFLMTQRVTAPVQQNQLFSEISSLYAIHDRDQQRISALKEEIANLREEQHSNQQKLLLKDEELAELRAENRQLYAALNRRAPTPSDDEEWEP